MTREPKGRDTIMSGYRNSKTVAKSVRLSYGEWDELDAAAKANRRTRNDEIRWRLAQHRLPTFSDLPKVEGQTSIFDALESAEQKNQ